MMMLLLARAGVPLERPCKPTAADDGGGGGDGNADNSVASLEPAD
jgi:hypothetical protein